MTTLSLADVLTQLQGQLGTPVQREREALTRQLIRAVSVNTLGTAQETVPLTSAAYVFKANAGAAIILCDTGIVERLACEAAITIAEGAPSLERLCKGAIDEFLRRLLDEGARS